MTPSPTNEVNIIIDFRENQSGIPELLISHGIKITSLPIGDYLIKNNILIERKSASDFIQSLVSNRLWDQCRRLRNSHFRTIMIIEGDVFNTPYDIDTNAIQGALISIAISWQLPILFSKDVAQTCKILTMIQSQLNKEDPLIPHTTRKPKRIGNHRIQFICGLPGVGKVMAKRLMDRFESIDAVLNASREELLEVKEE